MRVRVYGATLRTTAARYGGGDFIGFSRAFRAAAGICAGEEITVLVKHDPEPRIVDLPPDVAAALASEPAAAGLCRTLPYTHQREYAAWMSGGKREATRRRPLQRAVELLRAGRRDP